MRKTIRQLHEEFINECRYSGRLSENTLRGYQASMDALLSIFPTLTAEMLTSKLMTEFFRQLNTRKRQVGRGIIKQGIKSSTVVSYRNRLNCFFEWLKHNRIIAENPFDTLTLPTVRYDDLKYLKKHEVERIITTVGFTMDWTNAFIRKRNLLIFSLLLYTGIRRNELLQLKLTDLDLPQQLLTIRGETSKTGMTRSIPICSKLSGVLNDYLAVRKTLNLTTSHLLVSGSGDRRFTDHGMKWMIQKVKEASGINFHVHQFRHTFAVNLINQGVDISKVKQLLGHKSLLSTIIYLRCLPATAMKSDVELLSFDRLV